MRFICDIMLGKLVTYLRMAGVDAAYSRALSLPLLLKTAIAEDRCILTRRKDISSTDCPVSVYCVNSNYPHEQLKDVITHFAISLDQAMIFSRCLLCNESLDAIDKPAAQGKVPDYVISTVNAFSQCPCCKKIYWKGTHYENMLRQLSKLLPDVKISNQKV
jgi:uncharacterized protein with PIN domain